MEERVASTLPNRRIAQVVGALLFLYTTSTQFFRVRPNLASFCPLDVDKSLFELCSAITNRLSRKVGASREAKNVRHFALMCVWWFFS